MANDGQIVFEVTADGKHAIADIKEITRAIQQETGKWDDAAKQSADTIGNSFDGTLKKLAAGFSAAKIGKALLDIGSEALQAASDLQEVQNVVDVTFGASAGRIESWAKKAGTQFGLTETMAKRFTSTMGAMLKSSGLAGDQIVDVSTDLAGLAADMASFYNLDFEEAFSKIRSGMSGMTMPLKELGIDMSNATLNAFALEQGLGKTFDEMTQGEQTMLRYQYLMTATADAQGDFSRTSDGYANGVRQLTTNLESLKTQLGNVLIEFVNPLIQGINALFPEEDTRETILDRVQAVDIEAQEKIREIEGVASVAEHLLNELRDIESNTGAETALRNLALGANSLDSSAKDNWSAILTSLQGIDGLQNISGEDNVVGGVEALAAALAGESVTTTKAEAWSIFMSALADNADAFSKLTGTNPDETKAWLQGIATAAGELDPNDAQAWNTLLSSFLGGIDLTTDEGKQFAEALVNNFLAMGTQSEAAMTALTALGFSTTDIEKKQEKWLRICRELVQTIPGLSSIINTETGAIKGGVEAVQDYIDAWSEENILKARLNALKQQRAMLQEELNVTYEMNEVTARAKAMGLLTGKEGMDEETASRYLRLHETVRDFERDLKTERNILAQTAIKENIRKFTGYRDKLSPLSSLSTETVEALDVYSQAVYDRKESAKAIPKTIEYLDQKIAELEEATGQTEEQLLEMADATDEAADGMTTLAQAASGDANAMTAVETATKNADEALKAMADHAESVRASVTQSINSTVKGFETIKTPMQTAAEKTKEITDKLTQLRTRTKDNAAEWDRLNDELNRYNGEQITAQSMGKNLADQNKYMEEYLANLKKARENGVSDEVLAELSDGSVESYDYLAALAEASPEEVATINANYQAVIDKKKELAEELAAQQLKADSVYQSLQDKAKEAVEGLNLGEEAKENTAATIQGIADGIGEKNAAVKDAVDGILEQLNRLDGFGINIDLGGWGNIQFTTKTGKAEGSGRFGLDYVPHDDYIARLHEGEKVLTAQEASIYRGLANGSLSGVDLDQLGGVMRDNVKAGGNVYLDGRIVGNVISDRQGRSYKSLQRSGWQG